MLRKVLLLVPDKPNELGINLLRFTPILSYTNKPLETTTQRGIMVLATARYGVGVPAVFN